MNKERLLKLANHLLNGKLGHKTFNFAIYNSNGDGSIPINKCGTVGCAIGECPIVFPRSWTFDRHGLPVLKIYEDNFVMAPYESGCKFFGIEYEDYIKLFTPNLSTNRHATKEQVANNIIKFVESQ